MKAIKVTLIIAIISSFGISCDSSTYADISVETTNPTYTANIKPIMDANCVSCHNGEIESSLTNYDDVRYKAEHGDMLCRISGTSCGAIMPTTGKMVQSKIDLIQLWATNGYPN